MVFNQNKNIYYLCYQYLCKYYLDDVNFLEPHFHAEIGKLQCTENARIINANAAIVAQIISILSFSELMNNNFLSFL